MKKGIKIALCCAAALAVLGGGLALCVYHGVLLLNHPSRSRYPVRGVDVSHYQGEIDWPVLDQLGGRAGERPARGGLPLFQL